MIAEILRGAWFCRSASEAIYKVMGEPVSNRYVEKIRQLMPEDNWYSRACLKSVCGNVDMAFEHLQQAAKLGKFTLARAWEDPDLQWLRGDARFAAIVGKRPG